MNIHVLGRGHAGVPPCPGRTAGGLVGVRLEVGLEGLDVVAVAA